MPCDHGNPDGALKTHPTNSDITNMDLTDTITDHREEGATDGVPTLPVLPSPTTVDEEGATDDLPTLPPAPCAAATSR